jgi:hypothetical protein
MVGFPMVEPAHLDSSPKFGMDVCIYLDLSRITRRYSFSGTWRARQQRGACGDFVDLKIYRLSPSEVLIGVGCAYVHS